MNVIRVSRKEHCVQYKPIENKFFNIFFIFGPDPDLPLLSWTLGFVIYEQYHNGAMAEILPEWDYVTGLCNHLPVILA